MQINASASNSLNRTSVKDRSLNRTSEKYKLLKELNTLLIWKKLYPNENIDMSEIIEKYTELDFLDELSLFEYIKVIKIENNEIFFLIQEISIWEDEQEWIYEEDDLNVIYLNDFVNIFINNNVISLKENKFEIIAKLNDLVSIQEEELNNPASFFDKLKSRVENVLKRKR